MKGKLLCIVLGMAFGIATLGSCEGKPNPYEEKMSQLQSRPMHIPLDSMERMGTNVPGYIQKECCKMRLVVYTDTADCATCVLKNMYRWNGLLERLSKYGTRFETCFIFHPLPRHMENFQLAMEKFTSSSPVYLDTLGVFERTNPQIPADRDMHTFLLDSVGNVLLVGNPLWNDKIKELFWRTVEEIMDGK